MKIIRLIADCTVAPERPIQPEQPVQPEQDNVEPKYFEDIKLDALLDISNRRKENTPGDGHNNCGFNAILKQVGDRTSSSEMVNLLRLRLGYGDESSNQDFDTRSCKEVANLLRHPVVEICHNGGKIVQLSFSIPSIDDQSIHFRGDALLSQNFVAWCVNAEWRQEQIDALSQWLATNVSDPIDFNEATIHEISLHLLKHPATVALISVEDGGHFDAAPHKDLQHEASVLELLRGVQN
ncbi:MAG: hypothetical protein LBC30_03740 [Puniceicoccales bacterium]|jgi:hypothetical protein|nr:hypothetical protein [Puniceicoccales bacterium]